MTVYAEGIWRIFEDRLPSVIYTGHSFLSPAQFERCVSSDMKIKGTSVFTSLSVALTSISTLLSFSISAYISNNPSFRLKHPGVPDGSAGSGGISYPLMENQTRSVAQTTGGVAYLPCGGYYTMPLILATRRIVYYARRSGVRLLLLCVRNVVT
jgi:hypothetical protein